MKDREIYFHCGLGKAASTFLQDRFFPKLDNIYYLHRSKFRNYPEYFENASASKMLHSREMDRQFFTEMEKMAKRFPKVKIIIVFRRHDEWIASQYRRHIKNGFPGSFEDFIDLKKDSGAWKQKDLYFRPMLDFILENFEAKPLVLDSRLLKEKPDTFLKAIAQYCHADFKIDQINLKPKHKSYSPTQLKLKRKYNAKWFSYDQPQPENRLQKWLFRRSQMLKSYFFLYLAPVFMKNKVSNEPLIAKSSLESVRNFYSEDWAYIQDFIARQTTAIDSF